ncbi:hypothetical protein M8312_13840 [Sphingomonas sp. KRR8]|uniref:hypothetical protein n=1 Tax=Sphingomonas sp. KRR8 TaxID=2942996 RepID=UPI0020226174|nr:hypothetical protein [Sphingomonas sp. KRR8]URD60840.1 hypothetical protein M8312_13840 [Sphingomonas sp. KRR8]
MGFETVLTIGALTLVGLGLAAIAVLKGWNGWLELKKMELAHGMPSYREDSAPTLTGGRIEMADLKERVRKLEQIASGIDL